MARRLTRQVRYVKLPEGRIQEIHDLVNAWPQETRAFMRARLNQYRPRSGLLSAAAVALLTLLRAPGERRFAMLNDPKVVTDWQRRFELSGRSNPQDAWNRILEKEVTAADHAYLLALLDQELEEVHLPGDFRRFFEALYRAHIRKEYVAEAEAPKSPLVLVVGPSGSGKSATVERAIEAVVFGNEVLPEVDLASKREAVMADLPFWKTVEEADPALALEIDRRRRLKFYHGLSRIPLVRRIFKVKIARHLSLLHEQELPVDYAVVTPNDYQTALAGEPGNYLRRAMGDPKKTSIRHLEEAHSAFGKANDQQSGVQRQQRSLIDTASILLDEIATGRRDCVLIATTDQPERLDNAVYRRFVEKGRIIDMSTFWRNPEDLKGVVRIELHRNDIRVGEARSRPAAESLRFISPAELDRTVQSINRIFTERSLKVTPAYVRKLVRSVIEIKHGFNPAFLEDAQLVREAFELVARNSYGELYAKVVDRMDRSVPWETYVGDIKYTFSEMANNCLLYGVSEEKGVVLNGPPGGGKTFLVRTWLGENHAIHDIATSPSALQDPTNPIEGAVDNLEKIYDIAKMIAPTVIFFDEGDALAPKRSPSGGSPSDKLTNKFLNLIDGEVPLHRVFTVLTTNRLDILDPALIRSKRLKVLEISGQLRKADINGIVRGALEDVPLAPGLSAGLIVETAQNLCNTPADYTAFIDKARALRLTEYEVIQRLRRMPLTAAADNENFVKLNLKTLAGMLETLEAPAELLKAVRAEPLEVIRQYKRIAALLEGVGPREDYPLRLSHLNAARQEISQSPVKKGKMQLDEFLESELSVEPQVGFIVGVGANDVTGVLLPIATSLNYKMASEKVLVTGAVSSTAPGAAELDMSVKMTQQSAQEALTLVKNYLQNLQPKISIPRLFGEFLDDYTIHHQLLTASYNVGGPSAGYALALNTLSALLLIPVCNDFGITGAPWTRGVKKGEIGGSVIIGGHKKKAEKVLRHLRRMYMPLANYNDLEMDFLENYWSQDKDILGVTNFGDLVPEVLWLNGDYGPKIDELSGLRIRYKLGKYRGDKPSPTVKTRILEIKATMRADMEEEMIRRLKALRAYLRSPVRDPHISLEEIFRGRPRGLRQSVQPVVGFLRSGWSRLRRENRDACREP